jgi:ABC-type phosphate transport system substrate-binding protein
MAAPNIVGVTTILGITTASQLTTSPVSILSNAASSGKVFKINTILASNETAATASVTVRYNDNAAGAGTTFALANGIDITSKSSLVVLDKASSIYLEENRSITALSGTASAIGLIISYESISA